jgi:hypothetical protein
VKKTEIFASYLVSELIFLTKTARKLEKMGRKDSFARGKVSEKVREEMGKTEKTGAKFDEIIAKIEGFLAGKWRENEVIGPFFFFFFFFFWVFYIF